MFTYYYYYIHTLVLSTFHAVKESCLLNCCRRTSAPALAYFLDVAFRTSTSKLHAYLNPCPPTKYIHTPHYLPRCGRILLIGLFPKKFCPSPGLFFGIPFGLVPPTSGRTLLHIRLFTYSLMNLCSSPGLLFGRCLLD